MSAKDARDLALDVLMRVDAGAASDRALDRALRRDRPERRDAALATEIVYGVLRRQQGLDRSLRRHSRRPLTDLDPAVLAALRLGVYQCRFLDTIPDHAAVDSTVNAVKRRAPAAAGFVNGVLRAFLREGAAAPDARGADTGDLADDLEVPRWWARRWQERYPPAVAATWFEPTLMPAPLVLRPHPRVMCESELVVGLAEEGIAVESAERAPGALRVTDGNPVGSQLIATGAFSLRGEAGQLAAALLPVGREDAVLDACAGRGGKAIQIAEDTGARMVVASDVAAWRVAACADAAKRARAGEVTPVVADLSRPAPFRRRFDAIIVDVPCSGLGTVRRRPELKWRNDPQRLARLAELQSRILRHAADVLNDGGKLLYVTCSTEPEENEEVVARVLNECPALVRRPVPLAPDVAPELVGEDGFFRTYPRFPELEGFFAALLEKTA